MSSAQPTSGDRNLEGYLHRSLYHRTVAEKEEEFVINLLRPRQDRVLEVGPGNGRFTRHLVQLARELTVCDIAAQALQKTAARIGVHNNVRYQELAFEQLERLTDYGRFDAVVAVRVVPHTADWRASLQHLFDAVRPGGWVVFDLWNRQSFIGLLMKVFPPREPVAVHRLTRREIRDALRNVPGRLVATYRWGYPRIGPLHLDELGSFFAPTSAYSTLYAFQKHVDVER